MTDLKHGSSNYKIRHGCYMTAVFRHPATGMVKLLLRHGNKEDTAMKKFFSIIMVAALLAACVPVELVPTEGLEGSQESTKTYSMIVKASKGNVQTRALDLVTGTPNQLNVKWAADDKVSVFSEDWGSLGTLTAAESTNGNTTLSGNLDTPPAANDKLNLLFPRSTWDYTGQTGVLLSDDNSIEKKYDYALAEVTVNEVTSGTITTTGASFESQQAIVKFILKDKDTGNDLPVTSLNISAAGGKLVQSRGVGGSEWTPTGCEDFEGTCFYLELPWDAHSGDIIASSGSSWFVADDSFGSGGRKVVDSKYLFRLKQNSGSTPISIDIEVQGLQGGELQVSGVSFTNGAYYRYVSATSVTTIIPQQIGEEIKSIYGDLGVSLTVATSNLTVALRNESDSDTYTITASDGENDYSCVSPANIKFENGKYYEITMKMAKNGGGQGTDISTLTSDYIAQDGETLTGTLAQKISISIPDNATVTLNGVSINADGDLTSDGTGACISCVGNATIILSGTNTIKGFNMNSAQAIYATGNLVISGDGTLNASGNNMSSGIDGSSIEISSGVVNATGAIWAPGIGSSSTGGILISGGRVTATGGTSASGIVANKITITNGITEVVATGSNSSIGGGTTMEVKFGSALVYDGDWNPDPMVTGNYGGLHLDISGNTWTLTPAQ